MTVLFKYAFALFLLPNIQARGVNGGFPCAVCTVVFGIADQLAEIYNETLLDASLRICHMLPKLTVSYCQEIVRTVEPILTNPELSKYFTPDVFCYGVNLCHVDPGSSYCHLFPRPLDNFRSTVHNFKGLVGLSQNDIFDEDITSKLQHQMFNLCKLPGIRKICSLINNSWTKLEPALDLDQDRFSIVESARGSHWRGKDCEDLDKNSYPGRLPHNSDVIADYNCNGIWGKDPTTGQPYEEMLCDGTDSQGLIVIGDSISAHFHFPEVWMNPLMISKESLHNYTEPLLDELDWPQLGFATGYMNSTEPLLIKGNTDSIYLRLRSLNLCNHRDYQNLCRNGDSSFDAVKYASSVMRNKTTDKPVVVLYGMFGNDVCNNFADTVPHMTTPLEFRRNVLGVLKALDNVLPNNSHVVLIGLVDGSFLYPAMANQLHPLGKLRKNVYYKDVYRWFRCMEIGPCTGWLTPNITLREETTQRSIKLSNVLKELVEVGSFNSFKLHYINNPYQQLVNEWIAAGHEVWKLVEPVDGLHPNQISQPLIADLMWNNILKNVPDIFGKENPNNARILSLFGDQGGH